MNDPASASHQHDSPRSPRRTSGVILILSLAASGTAHPADDGPTTPEGRYQALRVEYARKMHDFGDDLQAAKSEEERREVQGRLPAIRSTYRSRFLDLAREFPKSDITPTMLWAVVLVGRRSPEGFEAIEQIRRDWAADPRVAAACIQVGSSGNANAEACLREILAKNPDRTARGIAALSLVKLLGIISRTPRHVAEDPPAARQLEAEFGKELIDEWAARDAAAAAAEAEDLFYRVVEDYADVKFRVGDPDSPTVAEMAGIWFEGTRETKVGKPAPDFSGRGFDGQPIRLADHRGKVVVLNFWASWSADSRPMTAESRDLVARFKDRPFVVIGINTDRRETPAREMIALERVDWPTIRDEWHTEGSIADRYQIQAYPATLVLDRKGIIRFKDIRGEPLKDAVDELLKEGGP